MFSSASSLATMALLLAAFLKWHELAVLEGWGGGRLARPDVSIAIIAFEAALGVWLLVGLWPRWINWLPAACFAGFAGVALYLAIAGAESCGCFGRVKVNPWITFSMDVVLAGALWVFRPPARGVLGGWGLRHRGLRVGLTGVVVAGVVLLSVRQLPVASAAEDEAGMLQAGSLTILEPAAWIGKRWPLLAHMDDAEALRQGRWMVVLHQAGCSTCREAKPHYLALARRSDTHRLALVELNVGDVHGPTDEARIVHRTLAADREWFASTPVVLLLDDGVVSDAAEGKPAVGLEVDAERGKLVLRE